MTRARSTFLALLVALLLVGLRWVLQPGSAVPGEDGVVRIATSAPPPRVPAIAAPVHRPVRLAVVATDADATLADEQSYRLAHETREQEWAGRSEAAIRDVMRAIPYVGGRHRLDISCAATVCEVRGIVDADPATASFRPVWQALERDSLGEGLGRFGLQRSAAIFDTGRNPDEFKIQYSRAADAGSEAKESP